MTHVVYMIGVPGTGKTTALRIAVDLLRWPPAEVATQPFAHTRYKNGAIELGRRRPHFGGTDALSMSVGPKVRAFVAESSAPLIFGEGDRLANRPFFDACPTLTIIHLTVPEAVARRRATERAAELRLSPQDASWWKGRLTKVNNLATEYPVHTVDATDPPAAVGARIAQILRFALS